MTASHDSEPKLPVKQRVRPGRSHRSLTRTPGVMELLFKLDSVLDSGEPELVETDAKKSNTPFLQVIFSSARAQCLRA